MKNLRKIIALFLLIFVAGIIVTVVSMNISLNKTISSKTTEIQKDTLLLIKAKS